MSFPMYIHHDAKSQTLCDAAYFCWHNRAAGRFTVDPAGGVGITNLPVRVLPETVSARGCQIDIATTRKVYPTTG
jgi:hypothetical protein